MSAQHRVLSSEARQLRTVVIDALWDENRFGYVTQDEFVGTCPVCGDAAIVKFAGYAARVDIECWGGCPEAEVAATIGLEVGP